MVEICWDCLVNAEVGHKSQKQQVGKKTRNSPQQKSHTSGQWTGASRFRCCEIKVKEGDLKRGTKGKGRKFSVVAGLIVKTENSLGDSPFFTQ